MKVNLLVSSFLIVGVLISCQKEEDLFASDNPLVGKWKVTQEYRYYENGVEQEEDEPITSLNVEFYNNNKGKKVNSYNVETEFTWTELPGENKVLLEYPATHSTLTTIVDQFIVVSANAESQTWEIERDPFEKYKFNDGFVGTPDTSSVDRLEEITWDLVKE
ncbi:MAG: hypothetical protein KDC24_02940 [Saprospiraceae bacterium]|nr:hypothetical protein [Saprospiraceae bacterium]